MTNQISQTIENWQTMSIAECLSFVDDLVYHASDSDEEDTLSILHELFFQEVNGRGDETLIDALASAIAQFMDPATVEELAQQVERTLGVDLARLSKLARSQRLNAQVQASDGEHRPKRRQRKQPDQEDLDTKERVSQLRHASKSKKPKDGFVQETLLEFIEESSGVMILREVGHDHDEPLVSITFSEQVQDMLGADARVVGQAMIHAAIASVVQRQSNFWHAHVYDEEPAHYS
ncbi:MULTISPECIES: hypothetical protein [Moraxella]|uniref:Uncharacterized protein n=1 Tax=Moraxella catarrhalis TaxID=480 RepID=A0A7Z0V0B6_MORCA|nr:hypothetical protein [Moraxella catarrhalis]OAV02106.1 hypothetical protein AO382_0472 [Moraxella catarrhalis]STY81997.1 Uncharacterised protein [Moraxella catarrhalis]